MHATSTRRRACHALGTLVGLPLAALFLGLAGSGDPAAATGGSTLHVPVLMYHRITSAPPDALLPELWISPARFEAQLVALRRHGWRTITAEDLALAVHGGRTVGPRRFVITIDDGARDGFMRAAPILARLGMVATYCLTPGRADRPWQISFPQMRLLLAAGHEIANHSLTHADLPRLTQGGVRRQVVRAGTLIGARVGHAPRTFCYPYGHQDAAVRRVLRSAGYLMAFTTASGAFESVDRALLAPRIRVGGSERPATLVSRLETFARGGGKEPSRPVWPAGTLSASACARSAEAARAIGQPVAIEGPRAPDGLPMWLDRDATADGTGPCVGRTK